MRRTGVSTGDLLVAKNWMTTVCLFEVPMSTEGETLERIIKLKEDSVKKRSLISYTPYYRPETWNQDLYKFHTKDGVLKGILVDKGGNVVLG